MRLLIQDLADVPSSSVYVIDATAKELEIDMLYLHSTGNAERTEVPLIL